VCSAQKEKSHVNKVKHPSHSIHPSSTSSGSGGGRPAVNPSSYNNGQSKEEIYLSLGGVESSLLTTSPVVGYNNSYNSKKSSLTSNPNSRGRYSPLRPTLEHIHGYPNPNPNGNPDGNGSDNGEERDIEDRDMIEDRYSDDITEEFGDFGIGQTPEGDRHHRRRYNSERSGMGYNHEEQQLFGLTNDPSRNMLSSKR